MSERGPSPEPVEAKSKKTHAGKIFGKDEKTDTTNGSCFSRK